MIIQDRTRLIVPLIFLRKAASRIRDAFFRLTGHIEYIRACSEGIDALLNRSARKFKLRSRTIPRLATVLFEELLRREYAARKIHVCSEDIAALLSCST